MAKFAAGGKPLAKKDLGLLAMGYGTVYVATVAMGANDMQTIKALVEAEKFKAEFHRDQSQMPVEHKVAADAVHAIELAESAIKELRAEVSGPSGIDDLIRQHLK